MLLYEVERCKKYILLFVVHVQRKRAVVFPRTRMHWVWVLHAATTEKTKNDTIFRDIIVA